MAAWIALVVAGAATWLFKAGPGLLGQKMRLPSAIDRMGGFVAPAVLGALSARGIVGQAEAGGPAVPIAGAVAVVVAVLTRSTALTVTAGAVAFTAISAILA